ncbi:hypothetical protein E2C01_067573 [Portunus trituberculatus]|uniref:Uncharacterized protein n=1 Tax=Portunus trituberculatus TaxID=210409 RepID=A0A5B7HK56_PORTR|nr:hypothetical protein [Portunus trituberculatus]
MSSAREIIRKSEREIGECEKFEGQLALLSLPGPLTPSHSISRPSLALLSHQQISYCALPPLPKNSRDFRQMDEGVSEDDVVIVVWVVCCGFLWCGVVW